MSGNQVTVVGVDEAGYGPKLGPLVVGLAAFRAPDGEQSLGDLLPAARRTGGPVRIDDSKEVYRGPKGLAALERNVLAFAALAADRRVPDPTGETHPWTLPGDPALPLAATAEEIEETRATLGAALAAAGVEALSIRVHTIGVVEFNEGVERLGTKADVLFGAAAGLIEPWLAGKDRARIRIDRHGGRRFYSELLAARFPDLFHWVVEETRTLSTYRFPDETTVSFGVKGDRRWLATALASMAAKYVRELHMHAFNAHFGAADPDLRPTAGYAEDAKRWLADSESLRKRLSIRDHDLIRTR